MGNKEMLEQLGTLDHWNVMAILDALKEIHVDQFREVRECPSRQGRILEVIDSEGRKYYLGLDPDNFVEVVRKDSYSGEIVYLMMDD